MTEEELIARLEKSEGPDRELDGAIALSLGWTFQKMKGDSRAYYRKPGATEYYMRSDLPNYTDSIDAALTLVPEHYSYELTQSAVERPRLARARLWDWRRAPTMSDPGNEWKSEGNRPLAIALCIASLRARAALKATTDSAGT